jgi:signal peptidase I
MRKWLRENRGFLIFLLCFGFFRSAMADWNPIPSASMRPTLLEGDIVLVNRLAYDFKLPLTDISLVTLGTPRRGEVVTFTSPADGVRLIKRLVGVPGDTIKMRDDVLFVNGVAADYSHAESLLEPMGSGVAAAVRAREHIAGTEHRVQFLPAMPAKRDFGPVHVPRDSYFFLGDNRDDSADSRYIGFVPRRLLIGRAHHLLVSADIKGDWWPRLGRFGMRIE